MNHSKPTRQSTPWRTPKALFNQFASEAGGFGIDLFASPENALCDKFFTEQDDAMMQQWSSDKAVFGNPPYGPGMQDEALTKAITEVRVAGRCPEAWLLVQANTSSSWWYTAFVSCQIWLFRGRIAFDPPEGVVASSSKFANALIVVKPGDVTGVRGYRDPRTGKVVLPCV